MLEMMKENVEDLFSPNLWLAIPAETIGTMVITLFGCGVWSSLANSSTVVVNVALAFGLAVGTMVWIFAHVSGSYFNPALTAAGLITRRLSIIRGLLYIVSQIVGAILGAGILYGLTPSSTGSTDHELGKNQVGETILPSQAFGVEVIVTAVLVLAYFSCHDEKRVELKGSAPLTIGLAVVACHLFAIPFTSCGMNPARSFGPAVILGSWDDHWVFWVGPFVGAVVAGLMYEYIFAGGATFAGVTKCLLRTKKPRQNGHVDVEKAPLEEVKNDGIEIEETKMDGEKEEVAITTEAEVTDDSKTVVEEVPEKEAAE